MATACTFANMSANGAYPCLASRRHSRAGLASRPKKPFKAHQSWSGIWIRPWSFFKSNLAWKAFDDRIKRDASTHMRVYPRAVRLSFQNSSPAARYTPWPLDCAPPPHHGTEPANRWRCQPDDAGSSRGTPRPCKRKPPRRAGWSALGPEPEREPFVLLVCAQRAVTVGVFVATRSGQLTAVLGRGQLSLIAVLCAH